MTQLNCNRTKVDSLQGRTHHLQGKFSLRDPLAGFSIMIVQCGCFDSVNDRIRTKLTNMLSWLLAFSVMEYSSLESTLWLLNEEYVEQSGLAQMQSATAVRVEGSRLQMSSLMVAFEF